MGRRTMAEAKVCLDCEAFRPIAAFYHTRGGAGRSDRCRECIEKRAEVYRAEKRAARQEEDAELIAFMTANPNRRLPRHLAAVLARTNGTSKRQRPAPSNRPQIKQCTGCGDRVPKREFWEYPQGGRAAYCKPCYKSRTVERECADCGATKLTTDFWEGLELVSPYCAACRDKRTREKHCPRCATTKPLTEFGLSYGKPAGWCKRCTVEYTRERRALRGD